MTPPSLSAVVQAENLTRRFDETTAVDRISLDIGKGEIFGLVGPDGAGKTTTLRLFCGLLDPSEGHVSVAGHDVSKEAFAVRDRIGYMAQRFGLYADLTVEENMSFYADLFGLQPAQRDRLKPELLSMTRMDRFRERPAGKLSGGMKQKLALMCTLLHKPEVLFLDEPTNGVDPVSRRDFWAILYQLVKDGMTVCITTAYLDEAERCNRVGLMHQGRIIRCAPPEEMRTRMEEPCYRVTAADLRACREHLRQLPGVLSVEPAGASLHLFLSPAQTSEARLCEELEKKGLGPATFKRIVPSLEDVFIALIRKTGSENAPVRTGEK
ncbi:MAG: ABC transporter ATP-binding protein [Acidobacteria bacterium]|nr:ABC transporter ATP-binding protein [Acidobacteriota bacterium]